MERYWGLGVQRGLIPGALCGVLDRTRAHGFRGVGVLSFAWPGGRPSEHAGITMVVCIDSIHCAINLIISLFLFHFVIWVLFLLGAQLGM